MQVRCQWPGWEFLPFTQPIAAPLHIARMREKTMQWLKPLVALLLLPGLCDAVQQKTSDFDLIVRHGTVYDGSGGEPRQADVGIRGDRIAAIGDLSKAHAAREIDAKGMAVSPGFVNMLSWAPDSLYIDGRSLSDIRQGVTLEVFGEGDSLGPSRPNRGPPCLPGKAI